MIMTPLRILVADDESSMRLGIERALSGQHVSAPDIEGEFGFELELVESGEEAVDRISQQVPDILLLDYKLPGMNGLDVLSRTADVADEMLTIMITTYASIETAIAATKQGAYDFLLKPFTAADLRNTLYRAARHVLLTRRARELEEEKKRVRFDFIRVLGHELKAPLGAVTTNIGIFTGRYLGDDPVAYDGLMERCNVRLEQMRKLIVDLLDMTRLDSGQKKRELIQVDLSQAITDAIELMNAQADERGICFHTDIPAACLFPADRGEIDMILNNLVSNAVKYNRDKGDIYVSLSSADGCVTIAVRDTGIGMSEDEVNKLFGEFVRIRNDKTANILGSGLGLSILKRLTELYDGRVEVESIEDEGSTFRAVLYERKQKEIEER